jgi:hypothetical protein
MVREQAVGTSSKHALTAPSTSSFLCRRRLGAWKLSLEEECSTSDENAARTANCSPIQAAIREKKPMNSSLRLDCRTETTEMRAMNGRAPNIVTLNRCHHSFHTGCLVIHYFVMSKRNCPVCNIVFWPPACIPTPASPKTDDGSNLRGYTQVIRKL